MALPDDLDPARLVAQSEWLRRLAQRLVRDAALAEDVAQETLLVALQRAPAEASEDGLRAWLHNVARNLARLQRRGDGRRARRERAHGGGAGPHAPATADVVARAAEQRRLIDAVLALDEPYRTAVLLAYESRLKPAEVARSTGVSPDAARKRISRGLALLRTRLEPQSREDRRDWLAGLALLARAPDASVLPLTLSLAMTTKWTVSALVCVALIALGFFVLDRPRRTGLHRSDVATRTQETSAAIAGEDVHYVATAQSARSQASPDVAAVVADAPRRLRGRVLLTDERSPVVGASLRAASAVTGSQPYAGSPEGAVLATTDGAGLFEFLLTEPIAAALSAGGLWTLHPDVFDVHVGREVVAHVGDTLLEVRTVLEGEVLVRVRTPDGAPVEGAEVEYRITPSVGSEAQKWMHHGEHRAGTTDAHGELRVVGVPVATETYFQLHEDMHTGTRVVIDSITRQAEVELAPIAGASMHARLVYADGSPASAVRALEGRDHAVELVELLRRGHRRGRAGPAPRAGRGPGGVRGLAGARRPRVRRASARAPRTRRRVRPRHARAGADRHRRRARHYLRRWRLRSERPHRRRVPRRSLAPQRHPRPRSSASSASSRDLCARSYARRTGARPTWVRSSSAPAR